MPLSRRSASFFVACGLFTTALLIGCSAGTGDVTGKVTYKGAILKGGNITFVSAEGGGGPTFAGGIQEDGVYKILGVREGKYKVTVDTENLKPNFNTGGTTQNSSKSGPKGYGAPGGKGASDPLKDTKVKEPPPDAQMPEGVHPSGLAIIQANLAKYVQIPSKYSKETSTPLTFNATKGPQTYDIELVE